MTGSKVYVGTMVTWDVVTEKLRLETQNNDYAGQIAAIGRSARGDRVSDGRHDSHANDNFLKLMGYSLEEIKGKHHSLFIDEATSEAMSTRSSGQS